MSKRDYKPTSAHSFFVSRCTNEECACGNLYLNLVDKDGKVFAYGAFDPDQAPVICEDINEAAQALVARRERLTGRPADATVN